MFGRSEEAGPLNLEFEAVISYLGVGTGIWPGTLYEQGVCWAISQALKSLKTTKVSCLRKQTAEVSVTIHIIIINQFNLSHIGSNFLFFYTFDSWSILCRILNCWSVRNLFLLMYVHSLCVDSDRLQTSISFQCIMCCSLIPSILFSLSLSCLYFRITHKFKTERKHATFLWVSVTLLTIVIPFFHKSLMWLCLDDIAGSH